jgi:hypothetical protein
MMAKRTGEIDPEYGAPALPIPDGMPVPDTKPENYTILTAVELGYAIVTRIPGDEWGDEDPRLVWRDDGSVCLATGSPPNADMIPGLTDDLRLERKHVNLTDTLRVLLAPYGWTWRSGVFSPPPRGRWEATRRAVMAWWTLVARS